MDYHGDSNAGGFDLVRGLTRQIDGEIIKLFRSRFENNFPGWVLVALGGYGRRDLCLYSDLDLLLLVDRRITRKEVEGAVKDLFYPLWDRGFNASYSVRTVKEAVHDAKDDFFFRTSLIDARFICGSELVFMKLTSSLGKDRKLKNAKEFMSNLLFHANKRHEKYGDATYILEPDLKEGRGGLRDYQTVMWAMSILSRQKHRLCDLAGHLDIKELNQAYDFLLKIRFILHELSGRKNDRMYLEYQQALAEKLGFQGSDLETSVETFLKHFHTQARTIKSVSDTFIHSLSYALRLRKSPPDKDLDEDFHVTSGQLNFKYPEEIQERTYLVLNAFEHLTQGDYTLSPPARAIIRNSLHLASRLLNSELAHKSFLGILSSDKSGKVLTSMLETGVLENYIPEFGRIKGRTIFGLYHTYTVDLHSINTVAELKALEMDNPEIFSRVHDRDALYLSAFLHDIGKGYGKNHEIIGAEIAEPLAGRLGLSDQSIDLVCFLIKNHIVLADLATKRDLSEERVAIEFAQMMRDPQKLSMIYLLTVADSKATGTLAWNEWKETLIGELYAKALHIMEKGLYKDPENTIKYEKKLQQLINDAPRRSGSKLSSRLWALPHAYILCSQTDDIKRHMALRNRLQSLNDIEVDISPGVKQVTLTIIAWDRPGLFSMLTGILALNHLEIISAKVFTWLDGVAVDVFKVIPPWQNYQEWNRIIDQFRKSVSGRMDIASRLSTMKALKNGCQTIINPLQTSLLIDNDTSDFFTLIEVCAPNKKGMLYHIAHVITEFGLDIHRALVSRNADLSSDVFYVVDSVGEKIEDEQLEQKIAEKINWVIAAS
jgi:[protein-PII] uridylyltransferase